MINSPNNKLDEFVKQSLENYQVPYNEAHWNEFESKLNAQPGSNPFSKFNFSLNTIIGGIVILSASAFIYAMSTNASSVNKDASQNVSKKENTTVPVKKNADTPPVVTKTETENDQNTVTGHVDPVTFSIHTNSSSSFFTSNDLSNPEGSAEKQTPVDKPNGFSFTASPNGMTNAMSNNSSSGGNLTQKELQDALRDSGPTVINNNIFPDQIDPLKGVTKSTKETDTVIKKANTIPENNDPLIMIGKDGKIISNPEQVLKTIKNAETKSDSTKTDAPKGE
jgi:hypothetical protein